MLKYDGKNNNFVLETECDLISFFKITERKLIERIIMSVNLISNSTIMLKNEEQKLISVNPDGYGVDRVYKNFDLNTPINII